MSLVKKIKDNSITFMKQGDKNNLSTLRLLISELEKEKVSKKMNTVEELTDEQAQSVITSQIKKLDKEIASYLEVGRTVEKQESEKALLLSYLPKQATESEIRELVYQSLALVERGEINNPMQYLSHKLRGQADMKLVAKVVRDIQGSMK